MKLKEIAIGYIEIPLVTPFKTALRTVNSVNDLIVKVTAEDGTEGYGEAPPTAVITGDTKESIEAAIRYYIAPSITGMDLDDLPSIMAKMEKCLAKNTTAKAAVDIALYDLYAKLQKKPLFRLLGEKDPSAVKTELETDITISVNDTDEMVRDSVKAVGEGFRILKVKVGKGGEKDVERIRDRKNPQSCGAKDCPAGGCQPGLDQGRSSFYHYSHGRCRSGDRTGGAAGILS